MQYHSARPPVVSLADDFGGIAHRFLGAVPSLAKREKQLLQDVVRGRYTFTTLESLIAIARRSTDPALRELLAECIRGRLLVEDAAPLDIQVALDFETAAQGPADVAAREFEKHPTRTTRERAISAHTAHLRGLRRVLDCLHLTRCS